MRPWLLLVLGLGGCERVSWLAGPPVAPVHAPPTDTAAPTCADSVLTWERFGQGYVDTWCLPCHSAHLDGAQRSGAPPGVDFDTHADVLAQIGTIQAWAVGPSAPMPPVGGPTAEERELFAEWIGCGAPGASSDDVDRCAAPSALQGDVHLADDTDAAALCAEPAVRVEGAVTLDASVTADCLCAVAGDLVVGSADEVDLPVLAEVGGHLVAEGSAVTRLSAPGLLSVGGDVRLVDVPHLTQLDLGAIEEVGGHLLVDGAGVSALELSWLVSVGGDLVLAENPDLSAFPLFRLAEVGGHVELRALPAWTELGMELDALETVGGDVLLADNPALVELDRAFFRLAQAGDITVRGNPALAQLDAFPAILALDGALTLEDNDALARANGFFALTTASAVSIVGNQAMTGIDALDRLETVGALTVSANPSLTTLAAFPRLERTDGPLTIAANPSLQTVGGFAALTSVGGLTLADNPALTILFGLATVDEVQGTLAIERNDSLAGLQALHGVSLVTGDLRVVDNRALPSAEVDQLVAEIDVIQGQVTASGNRD